jgi:ubiquinone/menaquinone biosynthesis C-methylase UbiE
MGIQERLLSNPSIFSFFNFIIGGNSRTNRIIEEYVSPHPEQVVVDIACGRGEYSKKIRVSNYIGIDSNPSYITHAAKNYSEFGSFHCCDVSDLSTVLSGQKIDKALLIGILHHLTDTQARNMIKDIAENLADGGEIISVDPVFTPEQGLIARLLAASDRGKYVRSVDGHQSLFAESAEIVIAEIREDWLRMPYTHYVCVSKKTV